MLNIHGNLSECLRSTFVKINIMAFTLAMFACSMRQSLMARGQTHRCKQAEQGSIKKSCLVVVFFPGFHTTPNPFSEN